MALRRPPKDDDSWDDDVDDVDDHDMADDEGPSRDDLRRFSGDTALCPRCGAVVHDDAVTCPECFEVISGETSRRPPWQSWWRGRWLVVIVVLLVLTMLGLLPYLLAR